MTEHRAVYHWFFSFAVDGHPNVPGIRRENPVPGERRLQTHNTVGYSLAREGDPVFEVRNIGT
jgi:hypothetical protein